MSKIFNFALNALLFMLAVLTGSHAGVLMAPGTALPDAGLTEPGKGGVDANGLSDINGEGIATETSHRTEGDEDFLDKDIDSKIVKIRPMSTPVDQISRYANATEAKQFDFKYFSVGTRPIRTTLTTAIANAQSSGSSISIVVADDSMFSKDDTIRVVGVKAKTDYKGNAYNASDANTPDLELCVTGIDPSNSQLTVYAINGNKDSNDQPIWVPAIPQGTVLIRMGKAAGELDVQTGRFHNIPTAETQYCQCFMMQVEQSTWDKIAEKTVEWNFSDLEEDAVYDMRLGMEGSFLFGDMNMIQHVSKQGMAQWFTKGIWWMAGKDIEVGTWNSTKGVVEITDDDLVDIAKDLFVGTGSGNKRKVMFCGSDMLAALSKIKSDKFRLKDTVEVWNLKFKSWDTDFGEILTIHHEFFDMNNMADCALAIDPEYLYKKKHISWSRNVLDLKKAGIRNTDAVVLTEASACYLRYKKAHARMKLAASS
jgi:hypothetical protein